MNTVLKLQAKLKRVGYKALKTNHYEKAVAAMSACATVMYEYNQEYVDEELEDMVKKLSESFSTCNWNYTQAEKNTVLFYDGFGLDTRGLAFIYLKALLQLGYRVLYVTSEKSKESQPLLKKMAQNYTCEWVYIPMHTSHTAHMEGLLQVFEQYHPEYAFLYTWPYDVIGAAVFQHYENIVTRILIDLNDHSYWIGKYAFDYSLVFREYGISTAVQYRHIDKKRIILQPFYPYVDYEIPFEGFPFDDTGYKVIFSGGSLYKTLGGDNCYYTIVKSLLSRHEDTIFLYAGSGDSSEISKLIEQFPGRVYLVAERRDLYQVMKHSYLYLNTYPMLGGLMTQYAAMAGKLPITLKHGDDSSGLLRNQEILGIEYETMESLLNDVDKLLSDEDYLKQKEALLEGSVITENEFRKELQDAINNKSNSFEVLYEEIDTTEFRKDYIKRFQYKKVLYGLLITAKNKSLWMHFPFEFLKKGLKSIAKKVLIGVRKEV